MATSATTPISKPIQTQNAVLLPRQVITQTLTHADRTTTAIVTLGPSDPSPPGTVPASNDSPSSSSSGGGGGGGGGEVSSAVVGIVVGSLVGAIVLGLLLWVCCSIRRRMLEQAISEYEDGNRIVAYETITMQVPQRTYSYWPRFPMSIPPPAVPNYRAVPPRPLYTANETGRGAAAAAAPSSYIFYDHQMRRKK